jgi:cytochrome c oxidase subunit 1
MVATSLLIFMAFPSLAATLLLLFVDRHFGGHAFDPAYGGDPVLWQHLFWFFGHPEVYVMILPYFGVISEIIPVFSRKPIFGYTGLVLAAFAIAGLSMGVWAHHMFTTGFVNNPFFSFVSFLIAVPTGVKFFNWIATMWGGSMTYETPMLFAIAFVFLFSIGGFSGLSLALAPVDFQYHNTYFVVAHFHYVLVPGAVFSIIAAIYYWIPKWTGRMYNETAGKWHFWLSSIFINVTFFPQHFLGLAGMPRRIPDYAVQFTDFNMVSTVGAFGFFVSQFIFIFNVLACCYGWFGRTRNVSNQVWEGATVSHV